ncbi:MAG: molecular chaperone DnaJ [Cyanobacteria bacterium P01_F01_bin.143]
MIPQIEAQLTEIEAQKEANQKEQAIISQKIQDLEAKIQHQYNRQNQLDKEAIDLSSKSEQLEEKLQKLNKIANLAQNFQALAEECQDNQELLSTLYSSVSNNVILGESKKVVSELTSQNNNAVLNLEEDLNQDTKLSIDNIKAKLPNAEKIYQKLVASYLEQYHTYQNLIVDELDLIWCAVAFIAFGRDAYRQMCRKHHPDLDGSEQAMQLINTAWEISQEYLKSINH